MKPLHPVREADAPDIFEPAPFEIDGVDARSVQKTPAGVLFVRRGLFFVKRQRRCAVYFQKIIRVQKLPCIVGSILPSLR